MLRIRSLQNKISDRGISETKKKNERKIILKIKQNVTKPGLLRSKWHLIQLVTEQNQYLIMRSH